MSVAAAVSLYLASGGLASIVGAASTVTALGIVMGLIGTDLVLLMVLLAARIPFIDHVIGQDVAMGWHRRLGKPALYLLLAHGALVTIGYAMSDTTNVVAETIMFWATPDLVLAYLAMVLFVAIVVTSIVAVRRKFPYEVWHVIHLLSYAAVFLALPHQLSIGAVLAEGTAQRAYWIALYVSAFGAIVWFRFLTPTIRSLRHGIHVESVEAIAAGVVSIHLRGRDLDRLQTVGGQYAIWRFWARGVWWHAHPISFSAVPTRSSARITVRQLGKGSAQLAMLQPGTAVSVEGPYGIFTDRARTSSRIAIIAAGIGITPVRTLLEHSQPAPGEAIVLLRGTDESQRYLWHEVQALAARSSTIVYSMVGQRPAGLDTWMSAEALARGVTLRNVFPEILNSDLYVCGPQRWADLVIRDAKAEGLRDEQIHVERFDW
ncbi:ferredoxin reductase family protein [Glaciibacter superstes]|uniref:ferredoxin reductase family protein n=1 Tax=Glaciibacter superstes TaxID=501023 RepID=UPI001FDFE888|nr:ferredoxin reductase family protein [Glaciibacter superstes]